MEKKEMLEKINNFVEHLLNYSTKEISGKKGSQWAWYAGKIDICTSIIEFMNYIKEINEPDEEKPNYEDSKTNKLVF